MRLAKQRPLISLLFLGFCNALGFGATYYVSTAGNNANSGLSTSAAWRNVQYGAATACSSATTSTPSRARCVICSSAMGCIMSSRCGFLR